MNKLLKKYYDNIKDNYDVTKNTILLEGILLIVTTLLALIFERSKPATLTVLYLLPISLIILSISCLYYASKTKKLEMKYYIMPIIEAIFYLLIIFSIILNNGGKYDFVTILGIITIIKEVFNFLRYKNHSLLQFVNYVLICIVIIICIILSDYILNNLYLFFILFYLLLGIKKILLVLLLEKTNKNLH